ncbi:RnfH family protein [Salinicola avicenniae]|uniref:RnfH family protein n=1 Tax=Salinicola avicenniae TaxID=2916836 RepID=UPI0020730CEC|nr:MULTISPECIES: RnfH family protein [unclassified Salinicola]
MATIEVAFATPQCQLLVALPLTPGLDARTAVMRADLASRIEGYDEAFFRQAPLGIFGERLREPERRELLSGERVEVYRPLEIDPKQARRERAAGAS